MVDRTEEGGFCLKKKDGQWLGPKQHDFIKVEPERTKHEFLVLSGHYC